MEHNEANQQVLRYVPPLELFEARDKEPLAANGLWAGQLITPTYHVDLPSEGGILSYHVGDKYPVKGWPFREAVYALDTIKRGIISTIRLLVSSPIRYLVAVAGGIFLLLPKKTQDKAIKSAIVQFTSYTDLVFGQWGRNIEYPEPDGPICLQSVVLDPKYFCDMVREIYRAGMEMASDPSEKLLIQAICMLLEFDDAYRYRIQDAIELIDKDAIVRNPAKEIVRILGIMEQRGPLTAERFGSIKKLIPFILKIRTVRNSITGFFAKVDLEKLYLDEADWYRCLLWGGYAFRGVPDDQRLSTRMMIDAEWTHSKKVKQSTHV
jgi:hypothetical protein